MDEFEIIRRHFVPRQHSDSVIVGVGDDGAVVRPRPQHDLVSVIDTLVADIHFPLQLSAADIGYRAVAVNVSDIAAMGAVPRWMTLALTLNDPSDTWLDEFASGLFTAAEAYDVELVGGDTTRGPETVVTVQINGELLPDHQLTRSGARCGERIYVSGTPGDAAFGLTILQQAAARAQLSDEQTYLVNRFARPTARLALGSEIAKWASAAIDLSDGLFADLQKLLDASQVGGRIDIDALPLSTALRSLLEPDRAMQLALGGGDDYELCFTAPAGVMHGADEIAGVQVTCIGEVVAGTGLTCSKAGAPSNYQHAGYRHFHDA